MYVTVSQFVNKYQLSLGMYDTGKIQSYIDRYEKRYLIELLGPDLYDQMVADTISGTPQSPNFTFIYNPFHVTISPLSMLISEGIEQMLLGFVAGNSTMIYNRYNEAVRTYRAIQTYIALNRTIDNGEILKIQVLTDGTGWTEDLNDVTVTGGTGTGATFDVQYMPENGIYTLFATVKQGGKNYTVNDVLTLQAFNNDATIRVMGVSGGDYSLFNGIQKQFNYWL